MKTESSVEIGRPIDLVFAYTNENVTLWSESVVSDQVIEDRNNGGVGTTFICITEERGQSMEFRGEVTEYDPPKKSRVMLRGPVFDIDCEYLFESTGGDRTRVTQRSHVVPKSLMMKIMFVAFGWLFKGAGKRSLDADFATLKHQLED